MWEFHVRFLVPVSHSEEVSRIRKVLVLILEVLSGFWDFGS